MALAGRLGPAPLVGRDRELAVLEEALAAAVDGRAQVVGVVGEAGAGKSRLCDEFAASAAARGITVRRTAGVSHATDIPLLPILALLRDYFGIVAGESSPVAREKVAALGWEKALRATADEASLGGRTKHATPSTSRSRCSEVDGQPARGCPPECNGTTADRDGHLGASLLSSS